MAYDPVQSLLAISNVKGGETRVFGQHSVEVVFEFKLGTTFTDLRFVKGVYLWVFLPTDGVTGCLFSPENCIAVISATWGKACGDCSGSFR